VLEESGLRPNQLREVRGFADRNLRVPEKPYDYSNRRVSILVSAKAQAQTAKVAAQPAAQAAAKRGP
jgi:chemotaxis protein MotB